MKMNGPRYFIALLTSIAGLAFSGTPTITLANDVAAPAAQAAPVQNADTGLELSAQRRFGGGGNVGRMVRPGNTGGGSNVSRVSRVSRVDGIGRVNRVSRVSRIDGIGRVNRVSRIDGIGRVNRISRINRISRYGRYGRIGIIPVPVPVDPGLPIGPGQRLVTPPCPVCPVQACLVAVYADPNLTGLTIETADNQPRLDLSGWQNQISSIIVKGGTWEFYPDPEYRGAPPVLRLAPGSYPVLEPQWTKRIGSFMCVR